MSISSKWFQLNLIQLGLWFLGFLLQPLNQMRNKSDLFEIILIWNIFLNMNNTLDKNRIL